MDITDDAPVERAIGAVLAQEGRIDALLHCAGVSLAGAVEDATVEEAKRRSTPTSSALCGSCALCFRDAPPGFWACTSLKSSARAGARRTAIRHELFER
jgi:NAD(P)-dependent dehydrogenase (short-subunit alcohol dehydrogenase family)